MPRPHAVTLLAVILSLLLLASCGGGPKGPAVDSPEWLYQKAKDSFGQKDYEKTEQHLEKLEAIAGNPFLARAAAWQLLLETGLILGHQELAEAYYQGRSYAGPRKTDFGREKSAQMQEVRRHALHMLEAYPRFEKTVSDQAVALEFPLPDGSAAPVLDLERIRKGMWLMEEPRAELQDKVVTRGILRGFSASITGLDDSAGARKVLGSGRTETPSAKFLLAMGESLSKAAAVFDRKNLNEPDKRKQFLERASEAAKRARESKPEAAVGKAAKKLQEDSEKALKTAK